MAATGTPTPNLGLRIPLGTDPASVDDINYNSNALDTIIGDIGDTSVTAQLGAANNRISAVQAGLAIVCNGNTHAAIESGQFAYVKNHGTLAEGLYRNNTGSTIAANATLSSSNLTADSSGGLNTVYESLNSKITPQIVTSNVFTPSTGITVDYQRYCRSGNTRTLILRLVSDNAITERTLLGRITSGYCPTFSIYRFTAMCASFYNGYMDGLLNGYAYTSGDMYVDVCGYSNCKEININITWIE